VKPQAALSIKVLAFVLSVIWAVVAMAFAIGNRRRSGSPSQERNRGSFIWISVSVSIGMTIAGMFAFSGRGALAHARR
jgi:protein-S-isoprenylcysteine O-methyltransferase Ste14